MATEGLPYSGPMSLSGADIGKILLIVGALIALVGGLMLALGKLPFGQLPGDVSVSRGNFSFAFPLVTCLLISVVLTVVLNIFLRR
ncbi:MAG TPA: DUF2905 domain-containing protein [Candidatus Dormibacteraeota bacterium]|nr:DUF2905 domain-containing protein [Candidatus Dormibacteraeota bacterium]